MIDRAADLLGRAGTAASVAGLIGREVGRVGIDRLLPDRRTLPDRGSDLTPEVLERLVGAPAGSVRSVSVLDENDGTSGRVHLAIDSAPTAELPATLFVKLAPKHPAQRILMNAFDLASREVCFYRAIAPDAPVRVPRCYGVALDDRRGRNAIALEDLSERARFRDIREPVTVDEAGAVVDALADLHASLWESPRFDADLAPLRSRGAAAEALGNLFVGRVLGNLRGRSAEVVPDEVQRASMIVVDRRAEIDAHWARGPVTLCHGDTHLGNLYFEGTAPGFLDWQAVMVGPGIRDVSYFLISSMDPDVLEPVERDLVARYGERLSAADVPVDPASMWERYCASAAEMYVSAVVTAGTADRMQPPEISAVGVDRVVAGTQRLETFERLGEMLDAH